MFLNSSLATTTQPTCREKTIRIYLIDDLAVGDFSLLNSWSAMMVIRLLNINAAPGANISSLFIERC
jgi:hypothetical protein